MAAPSQQHFEKPLEGMMKNLKIAASTELTDTNMVASKDGSPSDAASCISSAGDATISVKESDEDNESMTTDYPLPYIPAGNYGYFYPGYNGTFGGLDDQVFYAGDLMDFQFPVMQADNGSLIYLMSGMHPGYNPYGSGVPVAMVGVDGQYFNQPYPPSPTVQPLIASPGYIQTPFLLPSTYLYDPSVFIGDGTYGNGISGMLEIPVSKSNMSSHNHTHASRSKYSLSPNFGESLEINSCITTPDVSSVHGIRNKLKPESKSEVPLQGYFPFAKFPAYSQGKGGVLYPSRPVKANPRRGWEKPNTRTKINYVSNFDMHNEHNYGPRTTNANDSFTFGGHAAGSLTTDWNGNSNSLTSVIRRDQYNLPDFQTKHDHAFFFIIKSYSEDDVHKSIKYNVWASTPSGNKRLDSAYQDAQEKMAVKGSICPVFLFFSVNASGQFCGVAEMIGRVDFNKNMDFWQQNKWNGYFLVKWHIIKDAPNLQFRHIILENNENKPVTNSRDTQEVCFLQGTEMLNIFKNYVSKTSILDDFEFYESRQKVMQERRLGSLVPHLDLKPHKPDELIKEETKASDKEKE